MSRLAAVDRLRPVSRETCQSRAVLLHKVMNVNRSFRVDEYVYARFYGDSFMYPAAITSCVQNMLGTFYEVRFTNGHCQKTAVQDIMPAKDPNQQAPSHSNNWHSLVEKRGFPFQDDLIMYVTLVLTMIYFSLTRNVESDQHEIDLTNTERISQFGLYSNEVLTRSRATISNNNNNSRATVSNNNSRAPPPSKKLKQPSISETFKRIETGETDLSDQVTDEIPMHARLAPHFAQPPPTVDNQPAPFTIYQSQAKWAKSYILWSESKKRLVCHHEVAPPQGEVVTIDGREVRICAKSFPKGASSDNWTKHLKEKHGKFAPSYLLSESAKKSEEKAAIERNKAQMIDSFCIDNKQTVKVFS